MGFVTKSNTLSGSFFGRFSAATSNSELAKTWVSWKILEFFVKYLEFFWEFIKNWKLVFKISWIWAWLSRKLQFGWILVPNLSNYEIFEEELVSKILSFRIIWLSFLGLSGFGLDFLRNVQKSPTIHSNGFFNSIYQHVSGCFETPHYF